MNATTWTIYREYLDKTGDPTAAASLTLADAMQTQVDEGKPSKFLTVNEAAKMLSIDPQTVYRLCWSGQLAHHRLGTGRGTIRITYDAIKSYRQSTPVRRLLR